jgi:hypothetical protein
VADRSVDRTEIAINSLLQQTGDLIVAAARGLAMPQYQNCLPPSGSELKYRSWEVLTRIIRMSFLSIRLNSSHFDMPDQKSWLARLLPAGVSGVPGLSALADYVGQADSQLHETAAQGGRAVAGAARDS